MSFLATINTMARADESLAGEALRDLGLTRNEVMALQYARPEMRQQLEAMAGRFGLTIDDLSEDRWRALDISLACARCKKAGECANFLTGRGAFDVDDCPNSEAYVDMAGAKAAES